MPRSDDPIDITFRPVGESEQPVEPEGGNAPDGRGVDISRSPDDRSGQSESRYWRFDSASNGDGCGCGCGCLALILFALLLLLQKCTV